MAGYWIVRASACLDQAAADEYSKLWGEIANRYRAKTIAGRGDHQTVEGEYRPRILIIEIPTYQDALDCYNDPDYAVAMEFALKAYQRELVIIDGN